jgi:hypothetical protein
MRYFLDTEFIEDGVTIELVSIGIVAEDGKEFYAINLDCNFYKANKWVRENVLSKLPKKDSPHWMSKEDIRAKVASFLGCVSLAGVLYKLPDNIEKPEFWAYYADYDWVVFCQLFGTMMDLPAGLPMYCNDIKQECDRLGKALPEQIEGEHSAIADARHNKVMWEYLTTTHCK